jgi:hypothetical protein
VANDLITLGAGYRRRILIEPAAGQVTAQLEDDYHRMVVTLFHEDGIVTRVESEMNRAPWTGCSGAMQRLQETFTGVALAEVAKRGEKSTNCTHLHDLAVFASAHAGDAETIAYDIHCSVSDDGSLEGRRTAQLRRNGIDLLAWALDGTNFVKPESLAGSSLMEIGGYIASQNSETAEAIRILRWASIVALGRMMELPAHMPATTFSRGTCYNFQPERAGNSFRKPDANVDFSRDGKEPLADKSAAF